MTSKQARIVVSVILAAVVLAAIYLLVRPMRQQGGGPAAPAASTTPATNIPITASTTVIHANGYTITRITDTNTVTVPSYKDAITCPNDMSQTECSSVRTRDAAVVAKLNTNATDYASWLTLGMLRKDVGDYQGAVAAWSYVTKLYPKDQVAFDNLGDLYANFIKDYAKADANWLAAIKIKTNDPAPYRDLFTLYTTTSYRPSANAAENILKQGIAANPKAVDLQVLLARYYKAAGRIADASAEYDAAIGNANAQGLTSLAAELATEKAQ